MSSLMDGISSAQKITAQIEALRSGEETSATVATTAAAGQNSLQDPEALQLQLQQNFNDMLSDLLSTSNDDDDDNDDYFSDFFSQYTNPLSSYGQAASQATAADPVATAPAGEVSAAVLNQTGLSNDLTQSSYLTGLQGNILLNQTISQL